MIFRLSFILFIVCFHFCHLTIAQEDVNELEAILDANTELSVNLTKATFKTTRIIHGQSIENVQKKHLLFVISHRFGKINDGWYEMWGLDQSQIRLGLEYGVFDWLTIGLGRSSYQKIYDGFFKAKLIQQQKGKRKIPLSISLFNSITINSLKWTNPDRENHFTSRIAYASQLLIARKFHERFSLQLTPTYIHRNLVPREIDQNDVFAIGLGGRFKVTKRLAINAEYYQLMPGQTFDDYSNSLSLGVDIETGGHVFQLHVSNSRSMVEKGFVAETNGNIFDGDIYFGFNITRTFSFTKSNRKRKSKDIE